MNTKKGVCITLSEGQCQKLQALADESFRTRAGYIRKIITAYLWDIEKDPGRKLTWRCGGTGVPLRAAAVSFGMRQKKPKAHIRAGRPYVSR